MFFYLIYYHNMLAFWERRVRFIISSILWGPCRFSTLLFSAPASRAPWAGRASWCFQGCFSRRDLEQQSWAGPQNKGDCCPSLLSPAVCHQLRMDGHPVAFLLGEDAVWRGISVNKQNQGFRDFVLFLFSCLQAAWVCWAGTDAELMPGPEKVGTVRLFLVWIEQGLAVLWGCPVMLVLWPGSPWVSWRLLCRLWKPRGSSECSLVSGNLLWWGSEQVLQLLCQVLSWHWSALLGPWSTGLVHTAPVVPSFSIFWPHQKLQVVILVLLFSDQGEVTALGVIAALRLCTTARQVLLEGRPSLT